MRKITGIVTSVKMNKTIVVSVHSRKKHAKYKKAYQVTSKFYAHDEKEIAEVGDKVVILETKPLSKMKRWILEEKIS